MENSSVNTFHSYGIVHGDTENLSAAAAAATAVAATTLLFVTRAI